MYLCNGATLIFQGIGLGVWMYGHTDIRTYGCMDSHMMTKIFEINGFPNFLRYGAPLACRSSSISEFPHVTGHVKEFVPGLECVHNTP